MAKTPSRKDKPYGFDWVWLDLRTGDPDTPIRERSRLIQFRDLDSVMDTWDTIYDVERNVKTDGHPIFTDPTTKEALDRPRYVWTPTDSAHPPDNVSTWAKCSGEWVRVEDDDDYYWFGGYGQRLAPVVPTTPPEPPVWATDIPETARRG